MTPSQDYRGRMLRLADFLDALPNGRFFYNYWVGADWKGATDLSCGTTGCALGWASTIPEFRELGIRLSAESEDEDGCVGFVHLEGNPPSWDGYRDVAAVLFGLVNREADFCFIPSSEISFDGGETCEVSPRGTASAQEVAAHLRKFAARKWPLNEGTDHATH